DPSAWQPEPRGDAMRPQFIMEIWRQQPQPDAPALIASLRAVPCDRLASQLSRALDSIVGTCC
ncbi:MAG TPA: hypothetical protein VHJ19_06305, partial [Gammaproteobacteria bacterium]|nr:hypothetical protein [Gammaproteobacteria bacterium]